MYVLNNTPTKKSWVKIGFVLMATSLSIPILAACTTTGGEAATTGTTAVTQTTDSSAQAAKGKTLELTVQKVYPKIGFRFLLTVKDASGQPIPPEGQIVADAYTQENNAPGGTKQSMIFEWKDLSVTKDEYDATLLGTPVVLEWPGSFHLVSEEALIEAKDVYMTMDITLTLPNGTVLTGEVSGISIFMQLSECENCAA